MKTLFFAIVLGLTACASMTMGWYKPGLSQQEFAEDKYECMTKSQMAVSGAYVNASGGAASSQTTTNMPLFQACMQARGYVWTNQAEVSRYETGQQQQLEARQAEQYEQVLSCLRRFPKAKTSEEAAATSARCNRDPGAVPTQQQTAAN